MENLENQADDLKGRVQAVLETLRPALQMDGGDAELVDVKEGIVLLRLMGACAGCPMSTMTLKMGIEQRMKAEVPEIVSVEAV
ncbi:NifU family protein [Gemmatimonadota bacterium]